MTDDETAGESSEKLVTGGPSEKLVTGGPSEKLVTGGPSEKPVTGGSSEKPVTDGVPGRPVPDGGARETADWRRFAEDAVLWEASPRRTRALPAVLVSLVALAAVVAAASAVHTAALALAPFAVAPGVYGYLRTVTTAFVLTDRAVIVKTGILGRSVRRVEYTRVQNVGYGQGITGSLFGYGTVEVEVAGGRDLRLYDVRGPTEPYGIVRERAGDGADEVPGSLDAWRAVRAEVRALREAVEAGEE